MSFSTYELSTLDTIVYGSASIAILMAIGALCWTREPKHRNVAANPGTIGEDEYRQLYGPSLG